MSDTLTGLRDKTASKPIAVSKPGKSWKPLRLAPLHFQANPNPMKIRRLSHNQIGKFVQASVVDPSIIDCKIDWDINGFVVTFPSMSDEHHNSDSICFMPYDARSEFLSADGEVDEAWRVFVAQVESVWEKMEQRFRALVRSGDCRILARCDRPHAARFTEVSPAMFALYRVIDWKSGIAETLTGDRLYDIHVVANDPLGQIEAAPAKTQSDSRKVELAVKTDLMPDMPHIVKDKAEKGSTEKMGAAASRELPSGTSVKKSLYTLKEVVTDTGIKRSSLYKYMSDKKLKYRMHGTSRRFTPEDVAEFVKLLPKS